MELSAFQNIWHDTQEYVAGILNQDDVLKEMGVVFLCENARDVEYEVKKALQKTGMFAVVMTPRAIYQGNAQGVTQAWTLEDLQLQIVENPPVHRAWMKKRGHTKGTGLDVARQASERLAGPQGGHYGQFTTKTMEEAEREGLVVTTVSFGATVFEDYLSAFPSCDVSGSWSLVPFVKMSDLSDWLEEYLSCEWNRLSGYMPLDMSGDMNIRMSGHKLSIGGDPSVPGDVTPLVVDDMYGMVITWQLSSSNGIFGPYTMMKPAGGQTGLKLWNSYILDGTPGDPGNYLGNVLQGLSDQISSHGASLSDYYKKSETSSAAQISSGFDRLSAYYEKTETSSAEEIAYAIEHVSVDLTPYYKKTETSSAEEISAAVDGLSAAVEDAIGGIDFSDFYTKSQTSSRTQLQEAFDSLHECGTVLLSGEYDSGDPFEISVCVRETPDEERPLEMYSLTSADLSVQLSARASVNYSPSAVAPQIQTEWSRDGKTWTPYSYGDVVTGRRIMFQAQLSNQSCGVTQCGNNFMVSGDFAVRGNPVSLLDKTLALSSCPNYAFHQLFMANPGLMDARLMHLPFDEIRDKCFAALFQNCPQLERPPKFRKGARVVGSNGCDAMFRGCESLLYAPVLPVPLGSGSFSSMFRDCRKLTTAPDFPPVAVPWTGYTSMFQGCSGLSSAPITLYGCSYEGYYSMFQDCVSLSSPPKMIITPENAGYGGRAMASMFRGCSSLTACPDLPQTTAFGWDYSFAQSMFQDCVSLSTPPPMNYLSVGRQACRQMFEGCSSLTSAPALPATMLGDSCYYGMFKRCLSLKDAPGLPATKLSSSCYREMFYACSNMSGAPALPATTLAEACYQGMFRECSSLVQGPSLPAGDPAKSCYSQMFRDCDGMRDAPFIGLSNLYADWCCESMFEGTSVSSVATQVTAWNGDATDNWLRDVPQTGEFYCPAELGTEATIERGEDRVPMGWRVYNDHEPLRFVVNRNAIFSMSIGEGQRYEYSRDESSWSELQAGVQYYVQRGNSLYVRALGENETCQGTRFALSGYYYPPGYLTFSLSGSIMSLLRGVGWRKDAPEYCFDGMFKGCVGLTDADVFGDIQNAGDYCCMNALSGCTSLTAAPSLSVISIGTGSFQNWLAGCSSLTAAVDFPDASWGVDCFAGVMRGTKIEQARVPHQNPPQGSLDFAFSGCSRLNKVSADFREWGEFSQNWLEDVADEGEFYCSTKLGTQETIERGPSRCPYEWQVVNPYVKYLQWVNTNEVKMPLGVYNDEAGMSCFTTVSGDAGGGAFVFGSDQGTDTWRFFNLNATMYMDARSSRASRGSSYNRSGWNDISAWSCGFTISSSSGSWTASSGTPTPTGHKELSTWTSGRGGYNFQRLEFRKGEEVLADLRPAIYDNVVGFWDVVNEEFRAPTEGTWLSGPELIGEWLRLEADGKTSTVKFSSYNGPTPALEYTFNEGVTWNRYTLGQTLTVAPGHVVGFRAAQDNLFPFAQSTTNYCKFVMTGAFKASGKLDALISQTPVAEISAGQFMRLFSECTALTDASELELPATTLAESCYQNMFYGCTSLTAAPALPATTLAQRCYGNMFSGCTSLTRAPALPARTLANYCYASMFQNCTALTAAPALPATTLAASCYSGMFQNCTSLTDAPALLATTLALYCYNNMFSGCSSLSAVECGLTAWSSTYTNNWLNGVAAAGTFKCPEELGTDETIERGVSRCPQNWGVENPPPVEFLPWVYTNSSTLRTGVPASSTLSVEACLSGNSRGSSFIGNGPEDSSDWRFFNAGGTFYADVGSARKSGSGWNLNGWNSVSVWNMGWKIVNANGVYNQTGTPSGTPRSDELSVEENPFSTAWKYLKIYDDGTLVRSFKAARNRGVVGFWDEVEGKFYAPANGEWLASEVQPLDWVYNNEKGATTGILASPDLSCVGTLSGDSNSRAGLWDAERGIFVGPDPSQGSWSGPLHMGNVIRTNNAVLDTGYKPTTKTSISCWLSGTCNGDAFVGFYSGDDRRDWRIFNFNNNLQLDIGYGSAGEGSRLAVASWDPNVWNSVSVYNNGGYVQPMSGQLTSNSSTTHETIDWDANGTILVGGFNTSTGRNYAINGLRIFEDGELVRDYFPQVKNGVVGFEDRLDGTFLAPASGTWVLSSDDE